MRRARAGWTSRFSSTIGYERRHNELLEVGDEEEFVRRALAGLGPQPPNFQAIVALNRGPLVLDEVHPRALTAHEVAARAADGALLIDVRSDRQFDEAHLPGAICVPMLHAGFGTKLAWIADPDRDVILVGRDERDARDASRLAEAVGVRRLVGLLGGGMTVWRDEARDVDRVERLEVGDLPARRNAERDLQVFDVRERSEWKRATLDGSPTRSYHDLRERPDDVDPGRLGRGDLRLGPALGSRREPAPARRRPRRDPRRRRGVRTLLDR